MSAVRAAERVVLGRTGLEVAPVTIGTAAWGTSSPVHGLVVPEAFWQRDELSTPAGQNTFDVGDIPPGARPETVLERLATLRERRLKW